MPHECPWHPQEVGTRASATLAPKTLERSQPCLPEEAAEMTPRPHFCCPERHTPVTVGCQVTRRLHRSMGSSIRCPPPVRCHGQRGRAPGPRRTAWHRPPLRQILCQTGSSLGQDLDLYSFLSPALNSTCEEGKKESSMSYRRKTLGNSVLMILKA